MKRITAWSLMAVLIFSLFGCASRSVPVDTTPTQTVPTESAAVQTEPTTLPPPSPEGFLFFTVSRLTFTLAGESEDIYIGTLPREAVTWGTDDPAVAVFENGILTAVGPGETTAFAEFDGQRLECTVGCLAQTEDDLALVDPALLRTAQRFPPLADDSSLPYFADAAMVGDSITYGMFRWNTLYGDLGGVIFLCQGGASVFGFVLDVSTVYYQGKQLPLEEALALSGVTKAFVMLGQNDLSYMTIEETMEKWALFLEKIRSKCPDLEIYLQSCVPEWKELREDNSKNDMIAQHNVQLKAFAEENGCHFIDLYPYAVDHTGRMPAEYNLDNLIHLNEAGCRMWMQLLRSYAEYQLLKGETP